MSNFLKAYRAAPEKIKNFLISDQFGDFIEAAVNKFGLGDNNGLIFICREIVVKELDIEKTDDLMGEINKQYEIDQQRSSQIAHFLRIEFKPMIDKIWHQIQIEKPQESREAIFQSVMDRAQITEQKKAGDVSSSRPSLEQLIRAKANRVTIDGGQDITDKRQEGNNQQTTISHGQSVPRRIPINVPVSPSTKIEPTHADIDKKIEERLRSILQEKTIVETTDPAFAPRQDSRSGSASSGLQPAGKGQETKSNGVRVVNKPPVPIKSPPNNKSTAGPLDKARGQMAGDETIDLSHL